MPDIVAGLSLLERRRRLREYNLHVLLDDSHDMSGPIWSSAKELLEYLVDEAPFEISFVNHPESEVIGTCPAVANMMDSVTPNGTREILKKLDNIILAEMRELWNMPIDDLPSRQKLCIIVILYDLPTDLPPRSLKASVELAVKSLTKAQLPIERIGIQFVQVGFSRTLRQALEAVDDDLPLKRPDYANIADFTLYLGSMDNRTLWKIFLGSVLPSFDHLPNNNLPTSRTLTISPIVPTSPVVKLAVPPSLNGPLLHFPAHFWDGGLQTTETYDLSASFTLTGWIIEQDRLNSPAHDFFTFHSGRSLLFRASIGAAQGDCIGIWFPTMSVYPTARGFPANLWTFICVAYDGSEVRFGLNGFLSSRTSLSRPMGLDKVKIGIYASKTSPNISLANIKIYDHVRDQGEILSEYLTSMPNA